MRPSSFFLLLGSFVFLAIISLPSSNLQGVEGLLCFKKDCYKDQDCSFTKGDAQCCRYPEEVCTIAVNQDSYRTAFRGCIKKEVCGTNRNDVIEAKYKCCTGDFCNDGEIIKNEEEDKKDFPYIIKNMTCTLAKAEDEEDMSDHCAAKNHTKCKIRTTGPYKDGGASNVTWSVSLALTSTIIFVILTSTFF